MNGERESETENSIAAAVDAAEEIAEDAAAPEELQDLKLTQREALLTICDLVILWRSPEGETYATVPVGDHQEHYALTSRAFRNWMLGELARRYLQKGRPASVGGNAVKDTLQALEARAHVEGIIQPAPLRVAEHEGAVYLDRGTPDWSAIKVAAAGWSIVPSAPVPILRSKRTGPLGEVAGTGDLRPLRILLKRLPDEDFTLLIGWCLGALSPTGPYPILIVNGEAGSGKSTIVRLVQRIVDPVAGDLLQPPGDDRDLIAAARNGRVLAYDNLSSVRAELADSLCRLATGSEIGGRALYSDHDTATFAACRPLVLNGIPDLAARGDLADRSIVIKLGPLDSRETERDWWREVEKVVPAALAALLDALSYGLKQLDNVETPNVRMADFAHLIVAAEPALPWGPGTFLDAYARNRQNAIITLVEGDLVANRILAFAKEHPSGWLGLVSALYEQLDAKLTSDARRAGDWPGNPRWFSDRLRRVLPALRSLGINITERRTAKGSEVTIGHSAAVATLATRDSAPASNGTGERVANVADAAREQVSDVAEIGWSTRL